MSFKEQFEKWDLIISPTILLVALIFIGYFSRELLAPEDFFALFIVPISIGLVCGVLCFIGLDKFWLKVEKATIHKFLRVPSYLLVTVVIIVLIFFQAAGAPALAMLIVGVGVMAAFICCSSLLVYFRSYYQLKDLKTQK
jgi:hypothetical protein